jgi:hypothetical protein
MAIILGLWCKQKVLSQSQPTITTEQILATSTCSGQFLGVTYSTTGNFNWGNQFRAELSNNLGLFNNPTVIGWVPFNTGIIPAQIPLNTSLGIYRIRVVSTNPVVIGTPAQQPLLITNIPQATQIFIWPDDTVCIGDSIQLSVAPVFSNVQWSTGETGFQIYVTSPGTYSVNTFDVAGCEGRDTVKVAFKECALTGYYKSTGEPEDILEVYPNPCWGSVWVKFKENLPAKAVIRDLSGRVLQINYLRDEITWIDLISVPAGCYWITIIQDKTTQSRSIPLLVLE